MPLKKVRADSFRKANQALVQFQGERTLDREALIEVVEAIGHLIMFRFLELKEHEDLATGIRDAIEQFLAGQKTHEDHIKEHGNINLVVALTDAMTLLRKIADGEHPRKSDQVMTARSFCAYMMIELKLVRKARKALKAQQKKLLRRDESLEK